MKKAAFAPGQMIHHKLFHYRGVVVDVDPVFQGSEEWYDRVAKTRPPKDKPWYHVLVDGQMSETYVAEQNLEQDLVQGPIDHPLVKHLFTEIKNGAYVSRRDLN